MKTKELTFTELVNEVRACVVCPRMNGSARVLGFSSGNLFGRVMFIGEAPGRFGADQSEIPFHGDAAGNNFEDFLRFADISREEIFVTNAVLCNPKDDLGRNSTPTTQEIGNCSGFLRRQVELIDPPYVVTLGATALAAVSAIEHHGLSLRENVRQAVPWFGRVLIPLYHPGQRAIIHRSKANQRSDYQFVAEQIRRRGPAKRLSHGSIRADVLDACRIILERRGATTYFALHKLLFLLEYLHVKNAGRRLTSAYFIRQKDGPYCVDLAIDRIRKSELFDVSKVGGQLLVSRKGFARQLALETYFQEDTNGESAVLQQLVTNLLERYTYDDDADLKKAVYLTAPMRFILRQEMTAGLNMCNVPINFLAGQAQKSLDQTATREQV